MLQVTIEHYNDETASMVSIDEIHNGVKSGNIVKMEDGIIDVDVCLSRLGEQILINHEYTYDNTLNCQLKAKLVYVGFDDNTGVKCIKYIPS